MPSLAADPSASPELHQLRESLAQTRREYDLFAGRISHDLHAVLFSAEGFAAALRLHAGDSLDAHGQHLLQRVLENAGRGLRIVEALASYDRFASAPLSLGSVDLARIVRRAMGAATQSAPATPVEWQTGGSFPTIHSDGALLEHAVGNVLANAIQFRDERWPLVVRITGSVVNGHFELRVADNGTGFDPVQAHSLFQPFTRLHQHRAGIGMGLARTRRIVERLGGSVSAEAPPTGGAVLTLVLPLQAGPADPADAPPGALRILLIDDDPMVRSAIHAMLERFGHKVTSASGGVPGLLAFEHALRSLAFDLVLTDWGMPQGGGGRVADAVKAISPATPVVVVTGMPGAAEEAACANVDAVLAKPLRLERLRATLANFAARPSCTADSGE